MAEITETFLVQVEHEAGAFLARVSEQSPELAQEAVAKVAEERWGLDLIEVHIATDAEIAEAAGQVTDVDRDV